MAKHINFRDDSGELSRVFEYLKSVLVMDKNIDVLLYLLNNEFEKQKEKAIAEPLDINPILESIRNKLLRRERQKFKEKLHCSYTILNIKSSLLSLILKGADLETVWDMFQESLKLNDFDMNNQTLWPKFKKIKKSDIKRMIGLCKFLKEEKRWNSKFIANLGFEELFNNKGDTKIPIDIKEIRLKEKKSITAPTGELNVEVVKEDKAVEDKNGN